MKVLDVGSNRTIWVEDDEINILNHFDLGYSTIKENSKSRVIELLTMTISGKFFNIGFSKTSDTFYVSELKG